MDPAQLPKLFPAEALDPKGKAVHAGFPVAPEGILLDRAGVRLHRDLAAGGKGKDAGDAGEEARDLAAPHEGRSSAADVNRLQGAVRGHVRRLRPKVGKQAVDV